MKPSISAIILSKNEAHNLSECIKSLSWANEILVFDSGSTDGTQELARSLGARVETSGSWQGFGKQRQMAQELASSDWVFMIDADERVTPELQRSIEKAIAKDDRNKAYAVSRSSYFFGRFIRTSGWYPDRVTRLYYRNNFRYNDAEVHEQLDCPNAQTETLKGDLLHYTCTDFQPFVVKSTGYAADWAGERYAKGKRTSLGNAMVHTIACFIRKFIFQRGFIEGRHGFLLAVLASQYVFNKYAALWVLNQRDTLGQKNKSNPKRDAL